jgi:hypothetical protein
MELNELTIKELIASGQKFIPFSEQALQFLPKKYPNVTLFRWKKRNQIPVVQFKKIKIQETEFSFLLQLRKLSKEGIRILSVFAFAGLTEADYNAYFQNGIKIKPEIHKSIEGALSVLRTKTLNATTPQDLSTIIKFYTTTKLGLNKTYVQRLLYFSKTGSISPDTLDIVLTALKQKAQLL